MKRLIVLLSVILLFVTGCSVTKLDNMDINKNIKTLLSDKTKFYNVYYDGYKYYIPKGVSFVDKEEYNAVLRDKNNNRYYLYVDVVCYLHNTENKYEINKNSHFSKVLNYGNKTGYIQVDEVNSNYFIQFVYNYVKMEALVPKDDLTDTVTNMALVLRSVKFNREILESLIGENILDYKEEDYSLFKGDSSKENFLDVVEREETELYKQDIEDEKIDLNY